VLQCVAVNKRARDTRSLDDVFVAVCYRVLQ